MLAAYSVVLETKDQIQFHIHLTIACLGRGNRGGPTGYRMPFSVAYMR